MNLEDVIDPEYGLQQDNYSLSGVVFGDEGQLEVVGWSGRQSSGNKLYILKCNKCSQDSELFGEGYFRSLKGDLVRGTVPCGCTRTPRWSEDQFAILCTRKAKEISYTFLGFEGEWKGKNTKIKLSCDKHGEWSSGTIYNLIHGGNGCPGCWAEVLTKPDDEMIASFFASGAFHPETKFWRSRRLNSRGYKPHWFMSCPECGETGESLSSNLQLGKRPCACSNMRQQESYINLVMEDNNCIALKFGISINSKQRIKQQSLKSIYNLKQHSVYSFPSVESCKAAERGCKETLECGVVLKRDMPDGYTETTWLYNLEKVKAIYEKYGGVKNEELSNM